MCAMQVDNRYSHHDQFQPGPITSGYVSNSDIQQRERQEQIKWEQQREYEAMMNKTEDNQPTSTQNQHNLNSNQGDVSGLSLPLKDHDNFRRSLQDERHKEYNVFVSQKQAEENKRKEDMYWNSQNYTPNDVPVMTYDHKQIAKEKAEEKQNDYKEFLDNPTKSYRQQEERKKMLSRERNHEYNEFLEQKKKKEMEEKSRIKQRHRYTPEGGLNIGGYELRRKQLDKELRNEYKESLLKQCQDQLVLRAKEFMLDVSPHFHGNLDEERPLVGSPSPRSYSNFHRHQKEREDAKRHRPPPTPPTGLNIMTEQERKQLADAKKAVYRDELLKLSQEQMYQKAKQNGDIHVMTYNQSSPPRSPPRGRPPAHPDSARRRGLPPTDRMEPMEQKQQFTNFSNEGQQEQFIKQAPSRQSYDSEHNGVQSPKVYQDRRPQDEVKTGFFDERRIEPFNRDQRKEDYAKHLADLQRQQDMKHQKLEEMRNAPRAEVRKGDYYSAETYEQKRQSLNSEKQQEYQSRLSKNRYTPKYGLPIGQYRYTPRQKLLEQERNTEYNEFLMKLKENGEGQTRTEDMDDFQTQRHKALAQERNKEYNDYLIQQRKQYKPDLINTTPNKMLPGRPRSERVLSRYKISRDENLNINLRPLTTEPWAASINISEDSKTEHEKALSWERQKEYNNFLKMDRMKKTGPLRERTPTGYGSLKFNEEYSAQREKAYITAMNKEYNAYLRKEGLNPNKVEPLPLEDDFQTMRQKQLLEERHQDYLDFLQKLNPGSSRDPSNEYHHQGLPLYQEKYKNHYNKLKWTRNDEYNHFLNESSRPTYRQYTPEGLQGLPINQRKYDQQKRAQEIERNKEYNAHLKEIGEKLTLEDDMLTRRDMTLKNYMDSQMRSEMHDKFRDFTPHEPEPDPEQLGLPIGQFKYNDWNKHQRDQLSKEYNEIQTQKTPEPENRREWNDRSDPKGVLAGIDSYNYEKRKTFAEERKQEYKDIMEKQGVPTSVEHKSETEPELVQLALGRKQDTADPINLNDVKIFPVGEGYAARQRELQAERRQNFKAFAKKKSEAYKREKDNRDSFIAMLDRELMESPPCLPIGEYDTKKRQFRQEAHKEMLNFLERQPHSNRDKDFWNKTSKPRIFPQSGEYKNRKQKLNDELRKEWRDYIIKQEPPKERIKEFGTPGAVLFTGEYEKTKKKVREERTKDMLLQMEKQGNKPSRRAPEMVNSGTIGFVAGLGQHEKERERLNYQKRDAYNKYLDELKQNINENAKAKMEERIQKNYSKDGFPKDSQYWANGKVPPESWFQAENRPFNNSPSRDQPRSRHSQRDRPTSFDRRPSPSYNDMLESKRRQEANYRRDDPEYSRPGGPQYGPGPDYSRSGGQQYGSGPNNLRSEPQPYGYGNDYSRPPYEGHGGRSDNISYRSRERVDNYNRPVDSNTDRPRDRFNDRLSDRSRDRFNERPSDRPNDSFIDRPNDRPEDRPRERFMDGPSEGSKDRFLDRPSDKHVDRQEDRFMDGPSGKPMDRRGDGFIKRPYDRYDRPRDMGRPQSFERQRGPQSPQRY